MTDSNGSILQFDGMRATDHTPETTPDSFNEDGTLNLPLYPPVPEDFCIFNREALPIIGYKQFWRDVEATKQDLTLSIAQIEYKGKVIGIRIPAYILGYGDDERIKTTSGMSEILSKELSAGFFTNRNGEKTPLRCGRVIPKKARTRIAQAMCGREYIVLDPLKGRGSSLNDLYAFVTIEFWDSLFARILEDQNKYKDDQPPESHKPSSPDRYDDLKDWQKEKLREFLLKNKCVAEGYDFSQLVLHRPVNSTESKITLNEEDTRRELHNLVHFADHLSTLPTISLDSFIRRELPQEIQQLAKQGILPFFSVTQRGKVVGYALMHTTLMSPGTNYTSPSSNEQLTTAECKELWNKAYRKIMRSFFRDKCSISLLWELNTGCDRFIFNVISLNTWNVAYTHIIPLIRKDLDWADEVESSHSTTRRETKERGTDVVKVRSKLTELDEATQQAILEAVMLGDYVEVPNPHPETVFTLEYPYEPKERQYPERPVQGIGQTPPIKRITTLPDKLPPEDDRPANYMLVMPLEKFEIIQAAAARYRSMKKREAGDDDFWQFAFHFKFDNFDSMKYLPVCFQVVARDRVARIRFQQDDGEVKLAVVHRKWLPHYEAFFSALEPMTLLGGPNSPVFEDEDFTQPVSEQSAQCG